jgi:hypothetical protein
LSRYLAYPDVVFRDRQLLLASLAELGFVDVEEGDDLPLFGYHGDQRPETAALVVPRQYIGVGSNDLGFARTADGYYPIISEYDRRTLLSGQFQAVTAPLPHQSRTQPEARSWHARGTQRGTLAARPLRRVSVRMFAAQPQMQTLRAKESRSCPQIPSPLHRNLDLARSCRCAFDACPHLP